MAAERFVVQVLREVCSKKRVTVRLLQEGRVVVLQRKGVTRYVYGDDLGINSSAATKIAGDKAATSAVLALHGIPNVEHIVFHRPGSTLWKAGKDDAARMRRYFAKQSRDVVCKPNDGKRGQNVFRVQSPSDLQTVTYRIFAESKALAIAPFFQYDHEYRCVVLRGNVEAVVRKSLRMLQGDGKRTIGEICLDTCLKNDISVDVVTESMLRNEVWRCVPERGELFPIDWQHNVGRGALVTTVNGCDGEVTPVREIAVSAAAALNIDFATVDVVKRGEYLAVIEVNAVVSLERIVAQFPDLRTTIIGIYLRALGMLFGD